MKAINRLLRKNLSAAQLAGFVLSNFIGLAIIITGVQFYADVRSIWESEDSFIRKDYLVINRRVTASNTLGQASTDFTEEEIVDIAGQPWARNVGRFTSLNYRVSASMPQGGGLSTDMFFESIPSEFIDVDSGSWHFAAGDSEVPIIISKDYLTLYNFGFAASAGLPQVTEQMMSAVPLRLRLTSNDGTRVRYMQGRVVGYSNRLNTILVPQEFMDWSNREFGMGKESQSPGAPSGTRRLIIDVSSPGDVAIQRYLDAHDLEPAGDKSASQASYFLNIVAGVIVGVGIVITVLSFFILLLSISLLMQKNREKLHTLLMLGYDTSAVGAPYRSLIWGVSALSLLLGIGAMLLARTSYEGRIAGIAGADSAGVWLSVAVGTALALLSALFNIVSVNRKVKNAFRM